MLLTRLPLSIATAFDLHVLGVPPAYVLSHDQTLKFKLELRLNSFDPNEFYYALSFEYRHVLISRSPLHIIFDASENYVKVIAEETNTESDLNLNIFSKFKPF